jgi:hypothetical protein
MGVTCECGIDAPDDLACGDPCVRREALVDRVEVRDLDR